jgi:hypothetical protein
VHFGVVGGTGLLALGFERVAFDGAGLFGGETFFGILDGAGRSG